jgi:uncharacterized caspase-like protein
MRMKLMLTALFFGSLLVPPLWSLAQSQRGQGVRIKVETGQEIDLYDESHALVIGVGKYTEGWRELPGAERDAEVVSAVLRKQGFQVTVALNPTATQLNDALSAFISDHGLQERNRLLIYFAGHGHTEALADGRELGYVVPADAPLPERNPRLFSRRAISMDEIEAKALRIRSKHALFIFDSCFSGSIFEVRAERNVPPEIESKIAAPVRLFITAGTKNQTVPDDSVFRLYFVRAFEQREGDLNRDGFITGEELGMYLSGRVASDSRDTQTPRYGKIKNARLNLGDVVFALPRLEPQPPTPAPLDPAAIELAMWQSAEKSNTIADYEEYLRQYKQGRFAGMAHNRIIALRGTAVNTAPGRPEAPATLTPMIALPRGVNPSRLAVHNFMTAAVDAQGNVRRFAGTPTHHYAEDLGNGVTLEMIAVKGSGGIQDFWIGKYEVTQAQWRAVMGNNPSNFQGDRLPVENVCWGGSDCPNDYSVEEFCRRLNARLGLGAGDGYRLPKQVEWEYAARAGTKTEFAFGDTISPEIVNYNGNNPYGDAMKGINREKTVQVGSLGVANAWGIYDMHGNVYEWCEDVFQEGGASFRVRRGGDWRGGAVYCRSALRSSCPPGCRYAFLGFRLSRTAK